MNEWLFCQSYFLMNNLFLYIYTIIVFYLFFSPTFSLLSALNLSYRKMSYMAPFGYFNERKKCILAFEEELLTSIY